MKLNGLALRSLPAATRRCCVAPRIAEAFDLLRKLPDVPAWLEFTQADLDSWMDAAEGTVPPEQPRPSDT